MDQDYTTQFEGRTDDDLFDDSPASTSTSTPIPSPLAATEEAPIPPTTQTSEPQVAASTPSSLTATSTLKPPLASAWSAPRASLGGGLGRGLKQSRHALPDPEEDKKTTQEEDKIKDMGRGKEARKGKEGPTKGTVRVHDKGKDDKSKAQPAKEDSGKKDSGKKGSSKESKRIGDGKDGSTTDDKHIPKSIAPMPSPKQPVKSTPKSIPATFGSYTAELPKDVSKEEPSTSKDSRNQRQNSSQHKSQRSRNNITAIPDPQSRKTHEKTNHNGSNNEKNDIHHNTGNHEARLPNKAQKQQPKGALVNGLEPHPDIISNRTSSLSSKPPPPSSRLASGMNPRPEVSEEELTAKMEAIRLRSLKLEKDLAREFEDKEKHDAVTARIAAEDHKKHLDAKRREEHDRQVQRQLDEERESLRARKLAATQGKKESWFTDSPARKSTPSSQKKPSPSSELSSTASSIVPDEPIPAYSSTSTPLTQEPYHSSAKPRPVAEKTTSRTGGLLKSRFSRASSEEEAIQSSSPPSSRLPFTHSTTTATTTPSHNRIPSTSSSSSINHPTASLEIPHYTKFQRSDSRTSHRSSFTDERPQSLGTSAPKPVIPFHVFMESMASSKGQQSSSPSTSVTVANKADSAVQPPEAAPVVPSVIKSFDELEDFDVGQWDEEVEEEFEMMKAQHTSYA